MKTNRTRIIKVRVTGAEWQRITAPLLVNGETKRGLSRFVRAQLLRPGRIESDPAENRRMRLLVVCINNLNVIARRAIEIGDPAVAVLVISHLAALEREIRSVAKGLGL